MDRKITIGNQAKWLLSSHIVSATMKTLIALVFVLVASAPAVAQSTTAPIDSATRADIVRLLRLSGQAESGVQVLDNMLALYAESFPQVPEEFWQEVRSEFTSDALIELMIPTYAKYYTHEDILQLIVFYESPIGKKVTETLPLLVQETMLAGQQWGQDTAQKILEKLEARGYRKM